MILRIISLRNRCFSLIKVLQKDFPELKYRKIIIKIKPLQGGAMWAGGWFYRGLIVIDPRKYETAKDNEIIGALVHEMIHIKDYYSWNFLRYLFYVARCSLFREGYKDIELRTDRETIERGYAKELYNNRIYRLLKSDIIYRMKPSINYMSPKQIKIYAQKIGKW
jgi:hypothetical protein